MSGRAAQPALALEALLVGEAAGRRHGDGGLHGEGRAADLLAPPAALLPGAGLQAPPPRPPHPHPPRPALQPTHRARHQRALGAVQHPALGRGQRRAARRHALGGVRGVWLVAGPAAAAEAARGVDTAVLADGRPQPALVNVPAHDLAAVPARHLREPVPAAAGVAAAGVGAQLRRGVARLLLVTLVNVHAGVAVAPVPGPALRAPRALVPLMALALQLAARRAALAVSAARVLAADGRALARAELVTRAAAGVSILLPIIIFLFFIILTVAIGLVLARVGAGSVDTRGARVLARRPQLALVNVATRAPVVTQLRTNQR